MMDLTKRMFEAVRNKFASIHKFWSRSNTPDTILDISKEEVLMGFILKVEGAEMIELGMDNIQKVVYDTDTPDDSNARSTDVGSTLRISGKVITATDGDKPDDTLKLAAWSLVPAEKADCYRKVTLLVIAADQVVREVNFPNAFVVDYTESFGDTEGVGTFSLYIKQKKDKNEFAKVLGGYPYTAGQ